MKCPICAQSQLVHDTRNVPYTYKGESITLPAITGDFCPACGEFILKKDESARVGAMMLDFNKQVNGSSVDPAFIVRVRKKLNLDQQKAGEIFGGGVNAFSRYENGKTKPSLSLVQLLRVLDNHPDLIGEVYDNPTIENKRYTEVRTARSSKRNDSLKLTAIRPGFLVGASNVRSSIKKSAAKVSASRKSKTSTRKVHRSK